MLAVALYIHRRMHDIDYLIVDTRWVLNAIQNLFGLYWSSRPYRSGVGIDRMAYGRQLFLQVVRSCAAARVVAGWLKHFKQDDVTAT